MLEYITDTSYLEFEDEELECFFNIFNYRSLELFDSILYFSGFSGDNKEFVTKLKNIKESIQESKKSDNSKVAITQEIHLLNGKELELLLNLLNEAVFCAQCDDRYLDIAHYLDYLRTKCEMNLAKNNHDKQKILCIKKH